MEASRLNDVTSLSLEPNGSPSTYTPIQNGNANALTSKNCQLNEGRKCQVETLAVSSLFTSTSLTCSGSVDLSFGRRKLNEALAKRLLQTNEESSGFEFTIELDNNIYTDEESGSFIASNIVFVVSLLGVMFLFV